MTDTITLTPQMRENCDRALKALGPGKKKRPSKPKPVRVQLIERLPAAAQPDSARNPYPLMDSLVEQHHPHLMGLSIVLVWL